VAPTQEEGPGGPSSRRGRGLTTSQP
jgi:hypothetical protein